MINDEETLNKYRKAGAILSEVRNNAKSKVKKGAKLLDVANEIEAEIKAKGASPAFPVNISSNAEAAHYTPSPDDERVFGDDIVKLDIGLEIDGYIGDSAVTVDLSGNPDLVKASEAALENAIKIVKAGVTTGEIGRVIEETINGYGFKPVYNLTGHGLEKYVQHAEPAIPNKAIGDGVKLVASQVIAIEPFATNGIGIVGEGPYIGIFGVTRIKPVRMPYERELLKKIEEFHGLPFAERWVADVKHYEKGLNSLLRQGILHSYPVLVEHDRGLVSQTEHTMIVTEDGCEVTTR